jgi:glycosyltransferase involved in cell wall biosynthesis
LPDRIAVRAPGPPERPPVNVCGLIAAYDEAQTIATVVSGLRRHLPHVVVVDDGSTDGTGEAARAAGAEVLRHAANTGKGAAIRTGLASILSRDFSHVMFLDGDLQHSPDDAPKLVDAARRGVGDFVIGERVFARATTPAARYYTNMISSRVIARFFIHTPISDAQSGFRLISTAVLREVKLTGRRYEIETEMLIKLARKGVKIERVAIPARYVGAHSKLRPVRDTTRTCWLAIRYRFFPQGSE